MFLEWVYHFENYGTTNSLATLKGRNGKYILQVFKSQDNYFSRPSLNFKPFIGPCDISSEDIQNALESCEESNPKKELTIACRLIKQDFQKQANEILSLFS